MKCLKGGCNSAGVIRNDFWSSSLCLELRFVKLMGTKIGDLLLFSLLIAVTKKTITANSFRGINPISQISQFGFLKTRFPYGFCKLHRLKRICFRTVKMILTMWLRTVNFPLELPLVLFNFVQRINSNNFKHIQKKWNSLLLISELEKF